MTIMLPLEPVNGRASGLLRTLERQRAAQAAEGRPALAVRSARIDRAIALLAAAQAGLEIAEYTPNHIKKCVVGAGHAGKEQVQFMGRRLLPACGVEQADAADALAAAIAHAPLSTTRARVMVVQ